MTEGTVSETPMVDVKVTLVDGKFHAVDSSDMAFQIAGSLAIKEAAESAGVVILEPVVELEVIVPEQFTGDVMGDLNSKRGKIGGMETDRRRQTADPRDRSAGRGRALRDRPALHDRRARSLLDAIRSLRGDADATGPEGHRGSPEGQRGSQEVTRLSRPGTPARSG